MESETLSGLTPSYASPEMLEQRHPADPRDDMYALACIAHELLTGEHPFERAAATAARDAGMTVRRDRTLTRTEYKAIVGGLQFDREKRTPTVERFLEDLRGDRVASLRRNLVYAALAHPRDRGRRVFPDARASGRAERGARMRAMSFVTARRAR